MCLTTASLRHIAHTCGLYIENLSVKKGTFFNSGDGTPTPDSHKSLKQFNVITPVFKKLINK